jgi:hypothetical protein
MTPGYFLSSSSDANMKLILLRLPLETVSKHYKSAPGRAVIKSLKFLSIEALPALRSHTHLSGSELSRVFPNA